MQHEQDRQDTTEAILAEFELGLCFWLSIGVRVLMWPRVCDLREVFDGKHRCFRSLFVSCCFLYFPVLYHDVFSGRFVMY